MGKFFNVNGLCIPEKHYMVDISRRLQEIRQDKEYLRITAHGTLRQNLP